MNRIVISIMLECVMTQMRGLWAIDIAVSAMMATRSLITSDLEFTLTNGYRITEPIKAYHHGLWMTIITTFILALIIIWYVMDAHKRTGK